MTTLTKLDQEDIRAASLGSIIGQDECLNKQEINNSKWNDWMVQISSKAQHSP